MKEKKARYRRLVFGMLAVMFVMTVLVIPGTSVKADQEENVYLWYLGYGALVDENNNPLMESGGTTQQQGITPMTLETASATPDKVTALVFDSSNGYYHRAEYDTVEKAIDAGASVVYNPSDGVFTLKDYVADYTDPRYAMPPFNGDGSVIGGDGADVKLYISGNCSIKNVNEVIWTNSNITITGDANASVTMESVFVDADDPYAYSPAVIMETETGTFSTDISVTLSSSAPEEAGDIQMAGENISGRIMGVDKIKGSLPKGRNNIVIADNGKIDGDDSGPEVVYFKNNSSGTELLLASESDYNLSYNSATGTLTLRNLNMTSTYAVIASEAAEINIVLEGSNVITSKEDSALAVMNGKLHVSGSGTLKTVTTSTTATPDEDDPDRMNYCPAMTVMSEQKVIIDSLIECDARNDGEIDCIISVPVSLIVIKENGKITGNIDACGTRCENLVPYTTQWEDISGLTYSGKTYYFTSELMYPNHVLGSQSKDQWRVIGQYDAEGNPIPSNKYYQLYYIHKNGGPITNDFHYPIMFLIYDDNETADKLVTANDLLYIGDGKKHTINTDLYGLQLVNGDVTVNGNVTLDFGCFEQYSRIGETVDGNTIYGRDEQGNIIYVSGDSSASRAVINGDVGCLSLHSSFKGNAVVNGSANYIAYYDDIHAEDGKPVPETFYGSMSYAGKVVEAGNFTPGVQELKGYVGRGVYEGTCYAMTDTVMDGEKVRGTTAPVNGDGLFINVGANGIDNLTYPCVKASDTATVNGIKEKLTDKNSKITAMDISLIQDYTNAVEPTEEVNLYVENLTGFTSPALFHVKEDGTIEKIYVYDGTGAFGGSIKAPTSSFSTYFIAENQELVKESGTEETETKKPDADTDESEDSETSALPASPNTGDARPITAVCMVMLLSGMTVFAFRKKEIVR